MYIGIVIASSISDNSSFFASISLNTWWISAENVKDSTKPISNLCSKNLNSFRILASVIKSIKDILLPFQNVLLSSCEPLVPICQSYGKRRRPIEQGAASFFTQLHSVLFVVLPRWYTIEFSPRGFHREG